jgi:hypothetical protein
MVIVIMIVEARVVVEAVVSEEVDMTVVSTLTILARIVNTRIMIAGMARMVVTVTTTEQQATGAILVLREAAEKGTPSIKF